jgi:hypothetical protein
MTPGPQPAEGSLMQASMGIFLGKISMNGSAFKGVNLSSFLVISCALFSFSP